MIPVLGRKGFVVLPADVGTADPIAFASYQHAVEKTDKLPPGDLSTPILGLFGEIGSLLAALKKKRRDPKSFATYESAIMEELGDVLWYLTCITYRAGLDLAVLVQRVSRQLSDWDEVEPAIGTFADLSSSQSVGDADLPTKMLELAEHAGELVHHYRDGKLGANRDALAGDLVAILRALLATADAADIDLNIAARENLEKIFSRYPIDRTYPELCDAKMHRHERLPRQFEIYVEERTVNGKEYVFLMMNDIIIGDRLTDNKTENDDYRFHDVFHIAYAVHLGWSPVLRALLRLKRKSIPKIDENEDGARAILIEEGISALIFGRALEHKPQLFEGLERIDNDLLKVIRDFVRGFEPERCALWQWECAILDGFKVFRELKKHRRGYIIADLEAHTLVFKEGAFDGDGVESPASCH